MRRARDLRIHSRWCYVGDDDNGGGGAGGAGDGASWRDGLSEQYRSDETLARYASVDELARAHIEARGQLGRSITIPTDPQDAAGIARVQEQLGKWQHLQLTRLPDAGDATALKDLQQRLGMPEKPDGYAVPERTWAGYEIDGRKLVEGYDEQLVGAFRGVAHELGLTQAQFAGLLQWQAETIEAQAGAYHERHSKEVAALRAEWGERYDTQRAETLAWMRQMAGGENQAVGERLDDLGLGDEPVLLRFFSRLARQYGEPIGDGQGAGGHGGAQSVTDMEIEYQSLAQQQMQASADGNRALAKQLADKSLQLLNKINRAAAS